MTEPWFIYRHPGRSGNFIGHFVPALFFIGFGGLMLALSLKRARAIKTGNLSSRFAELHIPERGTNLLKRAGLGLVGATLVGIVLEGFNGLFFTGDKSFFVFFGHQALYFSFFAVGLCMYLESRRLLPLDTFRVALAISYLCAGLGWYIHAHMKKLASDILFHEILSYLNFGHGLIIFYSVGATKSVMMYFSVWFLMILEGIWMITIGSYACCIPFHVHNIPAFLTIETFGLLLVFGSVAVACIPNLADSTEDDREYLSRGVYSTVDPSDESDLALTDEEEFLSKAEDRHC